jgi:DnaK suppressor protein
MMTQTRSARLLQQLTDRRRELEDDVRQRIRDGRQDRASDVVTDEAEHSDAHSSEDVGFALLQMKTETLRRIDEALTRLGAGEYGSCVSCDEDISASRLRALPFAVRCTGCEELREQGMAAPRAGARATADYQQQAVVRYGNQA